MDIDALPENPYLLLTPGPLSTTKTVKSVMLRDWCTWDDDYHRIVQDIRSRLTALACREPGYTAVLMQGSGTFSVEATLTSTIPENGKLLVLANGAYGRRIVQVAQKCRICHSVYDSGEVSPPDQKQLHATLEQDRAITHVALVHCETTTGMLNPVREIGTIVHAYGKTLIVDAMSSFGGIPMDMAEMHADFLVSSANKCIQGVPGFGFVIAAPGEMEKTKGVARSLSLDLYDQWETMEQKGGKWRFTSPTHVVRAFYRAIEELEAEGGVSQRHQRYQRNQQTLITGMTQLGFRTLLPAPYQSPIITAFHSPQNPAYRFDRFYATLKKQGFVIYPGKATEQDTFRIGNIGHVYPEDIERLLKAVQSAMYWAH